MWIDLSGRAGRGAGTPQVPSTLAGDPNGYYWLRTVTTVRPVAILGIKTQVHLSHEREALAAQVM